MLSSSPSTLHETPSGYSPFPDRPAAYEIALQTAGASDWLKDLPNAHRLVQTLLQGSLLGEYELLDFLLWPEGIFLRVSLKGALPLSGFLKFLRERSIPPGSSVSDLWDPELRWIKLVAPEKIPESTRLFLERADHFRQEVGRSHGLSPSLFFLYRDRRHSR